MNNRFNTIIIDPGHGGVDFGYGDGNNYEKDFNLEVGKYIYDRLSSLGFPIYITRVEDETIDIYDRFELLNQITDDNNGGSLVFSVQVDNENPNNVSFIRSINRDEETNKDLYEKLNRIGEVKTKTLPNDEGKDFYAIQRLAPNGSDAIVIEFGYEYLNKTKEEKENISNNIIEQIISYFGKLNLTNNNYNNYVVEKGDSLYKIANKYNTSVSELKKINNLGTDFLVIGQILKVPSSNNNFYIVKKGDSLYSIAKKFNTTVDKIKDINNLISDKLIINQKIIIPN
ncbi:MAG: LysM peptidoglycan-binding domain-containing protein [Firmicutes bacterium]|nr:LysM peptidoglycan-binding domain-containing protein [Bacillota bacterium]